MAAGPVDMELKKAFQELQMKMVDTSRRLRQADVQIENLKKAVKYAYCTGEVVSDAPPDTKMYRAVGRMFLGSDYTEVMKILDEKINTYNEKIKSLESNKAYLEKSLKESENNLREMIVQKQSMH
uniref:Putative molecular chaperone prefoldin subunit 1 n=1 Tax=Hyalomma excavatum TaxID=257692 RepID=A0A131XGS3_9ACAR